MQYLITTTVLVDPARMALRAQARCPRTRRDALVLAPIAATALQHLLATARANEPAPRPFPQPVLLEKHPKDAVYPPPVCYWTKPDGGARLPTRPPQRHGARHGAALGRQAQRSRAVPTHHSATRPIYNGQRRAASAASSGCAASRQGRVVMLDQDNEGCAHCSCSCTRP